MAEKIRGFDFTLENVRALPGYYRVTVGEEHLDLMGHMNIAHYIAFFDKGATGLFNSFGLDESYVHTHSNGMFALRQVINYYAEVHAGESVTIHARVIGRNEKRIHFIAFMVNDDTDTLASTLEVLGSHADLDIRRTSPFPDDIARCIDERIARDQALNWSAPLSGIIRV